MLKSDFWTPKDAKTTQNAVLLPSISWLGVFLHRRSWHGPLVDFGVGSSSYAAQAAASVRNMRMGSVTAVGAIPTGIFWRGIHG